MLGIHIYQETEGLTTRDIWLSSSTNFFTRFFVSLGFIAIVIVFPIKIALLVSLVYGFSALIIFSYIIAKIKNHNPFHSIAEHVLIAAAVIIVSKFLGDIIISKFHYI